MTKFFKEREDRIKKQHKWIKDRGLTPEGYVEKYGLDGTPTCYGAGGLAIWVSDVLALATYMTELRKGRRGTMLDSEDVYSAFTDVLREGVAKAKPTGKRLNFYRCDCGHEWVDLWDCGCDDKCPKCGHATEPYHSQDVMAPVIEEVVKT